MTAQTPDRFLYNGEEYWLIGINGGRLFVPEVEGMIPTMISTGCYRGFYCVYELLSDRIVLRELTIHERDDNYIPLDGVTAIKDNHDRMTYKGLSRTVDFSGSLRLGRDFIRELYLHMGYQKASAFKIVLDFTITDGKIVKVADRSEEIEARRGQFRDQFAKGSNSIDDAFSLDMDLE